MPCLQWNAAVHCVMVRIVSILHMNKDRHGMTSYVSDVHMVNQSALWWCWAMYNLRETITRHEAQDGRVLTMLDVFVEIAKYNTW